MSLIFIVTVRLQNMFTTDEGPAVHRMGVPLVYLILQICANISEKFIRICTNSYKKYTHGMYFG